MGKLQLYTIIALGAFSLTMAGGFWYSWGKWGEFKDKYETVQIAREKAEENLQLVSDQLQNERETRELAEEALSKLRSVPDVDYNTPLPDSVRNVLRSFNDGLQ